MPLYPQPRQRPSTRPRKPQPPPVPRDETGTPFPPPPSPRSRSRSRAHRPRRRPLSPRVRKAILQLRDTYLHHLEAKRRAAEDQRYRQLFRGRRQETPPQDRRHQKQKQKQEQGRPASDSAPAPAPAPPCLRCAIKGLSCSAALPRGRDDVRCRRCERNGDEFCVRQRQDLTGGQVLGPAWLREAGRKGGKSKSKSKSTSKNGSSSPTVREAPGENEVEGGGQARRLVDPFGAAGGGSGAEVWEVERMVYCLDPVLRGDRRRLLDVAADMLHRDGARFVHGIEVSPVHARGFALPMWHENDKPENKRDPGYLVRTPAAYFREVEAKREERRVQMEMRMGRKKAEEAQEAEKKSAEMELRAEKKRVDEEKEKARRYYREQGSAQDIAKRRSARRRVIMEQMALGKHPMDIMPYMDGLTDRWIEEIKLGLRTDLPF